MKYTEGAFRNWGYALAEREFGDHVYTWDQWEKTKSEQGEEAANDEQTKAINNGAILVKDAIADITLQQVLTRPSEFDVIATMNLKKALKPIRVFYHSSKKLFLMNIRK